jgi:hypothetical protein
VVRIATMKIASDIVMKLLVLLRNSTVRNVWERKAPDLDAVLKNIAMLTESDSKDGYRIRKKVMGMIVKKK